MYLPAVWGTRTQEIEFQTSLDGKLYSPLVEKASYKFEEGTNHVTLTLPEGSVGQYIKIIGTANDEVDKPGMQFSEFEVYGSYGQHVEGVTVNPKEAEMKALANLQLEATFAPENATNKLVAWSSSNFDVARVDANGLVTAVAPGEAVIRARSIDGNFKDTCTVTIVKNNVVSVLNPEPMEVALGTELTAEELPKTVKVKLDQDAEAELEVTWDTSGYNRNVPGTYEILGTLTETELVENPDSVQAKLSVTVLPSETAHNVVVENGSGSGQYEKDTIISIKANEPEEGMRFDKWVSEDVKVEDANAEETTFVMPEKDVTITATYKVIPTLDALEEVLNNGKDIDRDAYTEESLAVLDEAIANAEEVLAKAEEATEEEIQAAMDMLAEAMEGLVEKSGWMETEDGWIYYTDGEKAVGWKEISGTWYYFDENGIMETGWLSEGNTWYYLNNSGAMETGWVSVNGHWYYMDQWGAMMTGWALIGDNWYYLNNSGAMETGWVFVGDKWYYMNKSGVMETGWVLVGDDWYYMNTDGTMATSQWIGDYYVGASGKMV